MDPLRDDLDYRCLFDSVPDPCPVLDPDVRIVWVNHAYLEMTTREDILGHGLFEIFPAQSAETASEGGLRVRYWSPIDSPVTKGDRDRRDLW